MKLTLKKIMTLLMVAAFSASAMAAEPTDAELAAFTRLSMKLNKVPGYTVTANNQDYSIELKDSKTGNTDFWVSVSTKHKNAVYVLNERGFSIAKGADSEKKLRAAEVAKGEVTSMFGNVSVNIQRQDEKHAITFAMTKNESADIFAENISDYIKTMKQVKSDFQARYKEALNSVPEDINKYTNPVKDEPVVPMTKPNSKKNSNKRVLPKKIADGGVVNIKPTLSAKNMVVKCLDYASKEIKDPAGQIPANNCRFLQVKCDLDPQTEGIYDVNLKVTDSAGKLIVEDEADDVTQHKLLYLKKGAKPVTFEAIGVDNEAFWTPGCYTVEIWYDGKPVGTQLINLY